MLTIAVQAGGRSKRMGQDKALMLLGGVPLIEHVLRRLHGLGDELLITTNDQDRYAYLGLRMVSDRSPGAGALHGLLTALDAAQGDRVLVVGCDMPFLSRPLLDHMLNIAATDIVVIPRRDEQFEPLHAVYPKSVREAILAAVDRNEHRMISFLPDVKVLAVEGEALTRLDPLGLSFFNVNTPADLVRAESLLNDG